jgi:hypothetical protein
VPAAATEGTHIQDLIHELTETVVDLRKRESAFVTP